MHWTVNLNVGPRRVEHAAVAVGDKIYFFGGYCETEVDFKKPIIVNMLNTKTYRWCFLPPGGGSGNDRDMLTRTPFLLRGHSAVVYGDKIYIWGGRTYARDSDTLLCYDTVTHKWSWPKVTGTIPEGRFGHTACIIDNCMYIFGGESSEIQNLKSNDVYCLDLLSLNWKRLYINGDPPPCLSYSTAHAVGKRMYIVGGVINDTSSDYYSDVMYLDTSTRRWHKPFVNGMKPPVRGKHSAFIYKEYLYVFGGYNSATGEHFNDLHRFNLEENEWQRVNPLGELPKARHRHSSILVGEKVFVFGGTSCYPFSSVSTGLTAMVLFHRNDLHVLDLCPSLRTLCLQVVIQHKLDTNILPEGLKKELSFISPDKSVVIYV